MKTVAAAEFKARCLTLMEDVRSTRRALLITKRGKPFVRLMPLEDSKDKFFDRLKGVIKIVGDIEAPIEDGTWESS